MPTSPNVSPGQQRWSPLSFLRLVFPSVVHSCWPWWTVLWALSWSIVLGWMFIPICLFLQFSSITQSCLTLFNPMDCSTAGLPGHHQLGACSNSCPLSWWCHPTISSSVVPFSSRLQSFPASGSFPTSQLFAWGGQSIGVSASASVLPMNIQDWFPLIPSSTICHVNSSISTLFNMGCYFLQASKSPPNRVFPISCRFLLIYWNCVTRKCPQLNKLLFIQSYIQHYWLYTFKTQFQETLLDPAGPCLLIFAISLVCEVFPSLIHITSWIMLGLNCSAWAGGQGGE